MSPAPVSVKAKPNTYLCSCMHVHTLKPWPEMWTSTNRKHDVYGIHLNRKNTHTNMNIMNCLGLVLLSSWSGSKPIVEYSHTSGLARSWQDHLPSSCVQDLGLPDLLQPVSEACGSTSAAFTYIYERDNWDLVRM